MSDLIDVLTERIEQLTLNQAELSEQNRVLQAENTQLRRRVVALERASTRRVTMNGIAVGDRVGIHRPTIPSNLECSRIIPEDRIGTVI